MEPQALRAIAPLRGLVAAGEPQVIRLLEMAQAAGYRALAAAAADQQPQAERAVLEAMAHAVKSGLWNTKKTRLQV